MNVRTMLVAVSLCDDVSCAGICRVSTMRQPRMKSKQRGSSSLCSSSVVHWCPNIKPRSMIRQKATEGFTPAFVGETLTTRFRNQEHIDLSQPDGTSQGALLRSLLESQKEAGGVLSSGDQSARHRFQGFPPTLFARKAGEQFFEKTGIKLKLTANRLSFSGQQAGRFRDGSPENVRRFQASQGSTLRQEHAGGRQAGAPV
mgnify:CR=1 FL=1